MKTLILITFLSLNSFALDCAQINSDRVAAYKAAKPELKSPELDKLMKSVLEESYKNCKSKEQGI